VASGKRLYLPWIEATKGVVAEVDPATGTARRRVVVAPGESGGVAVRFNTPPAIGRGLLFWPSSRLLHAYDLASGAPRWTYEATGPTPFRRFQLGSEPPLLGRRTVYWAHQQGVAAVDLATGRARWTWAAYRGFALRALLGERAVYAFTDGAAVALDRRTGAVAWQFAPPGLLFEHLAGESLAGLFRGRLFFVGEPAPFRYRLYHVDAASGRGLAWAHVPGRGLTGSAAADDARLYARLGADLLAIDLATARPLWRARVGAEGGAASPALGAGRVWVVGGETLWGFDLSLSRRAGGPSRSRGAR
jgi:outer membrane protein assembly factor BamB